MKILKLTAENFKRLTAVEITPEGNSILITGRNEQGKSAVLDAIWAALGGGRATPSKPIHLGAERTEICVLLGENGVPKFRVTRTWTSNERTYLKVESADIDERRSPQAILDDLCGDLTFNPQGFAQMDAAKRREVLLGLVDLGIDLTAWEAERKRLEDDRTALNRDAKNAKGALVNFQSRLEMPDGIPDEETSVSALTAKLSEGRRKNTENDTARKDVDGASRRMEEALEELVDARENVARLERELAAAHKVVANYESNVSAREAAYKAVVKSTSRLVDVDLAAIEAEIGQADSVNALVRKKAELQRLEAASVAATKAAARAQEAVDAHRAEKEAALRKATFPVPGLSIDEDGVTFKELPFEQASEEEKLRVSVAIGMALNPKLRVMLLHEKARLDSVHLKMIEEMAEAQDYQLWIERVEDEAGVGIYIEDGAIAGAAKTDAQLDLEKEPA